MTEQVKYRTREQARQNRLRQRLDALQTPKKTDPADFNVACQQFKQVCQQIKEFAGFEEFYGGFDEAMAFLQSPAFAADKVQGTYLFGLWQGADKAATYAAAQLGIDQPDWWYRCWGKNKGEGEA